jgi:putative peptide maturation dehydrogenase
MKMAPGWSIWIKVLAEVQRTGRSVVRVRRCEILMFESQEQVAFKLESLLEGGNGMVRTLQWLALAPHLGDSVMVSSAQREVLGTLSPSLWTDVDTLGSATRLELDALIDHGLVVMEAPAVGSVAERQRRDDDRLRAAHWHPLGAILHAFTRWDSVDAVKNTQDSGTETAAGMRDVLGPPPAVTRSEGQGDAVALPHAEPDAFDALLQRRATCRNFDDSRPLPMALFTRMLGRVFAAQAKIRVGDDLVFHKKNSPSGGGLHPMEAYLIVQQVEGIAPGLYRYLADSHSLLPLTAPDQPLRDFIMESVGQQHWFANAHCLVTMVPRFDRSFWKYRRHAKGYRVVTLEAGHLSQTLYLSATDLGLGAFITGAINEKHLERGFGLDPIQQGALAVCGFGWRAQHMETAELDPLEQVWQRVG